MDAFPRRSAGDEPLRIVLLGSTGSIGSQAVDVIRSHPGRFDVVALCSGGRDLDAIASQAAELLPSHVGVARGDASGELVSGCSPAGRPGAGCRRSSTVPPRRHSWPSWTRTWC
jgi:1-deoxy-D-xylulose-5-phosphate reductoisomerase